MDHDDTIDNILENGEFFDNMVNGYYIILYSSCCLVFNEDVPYEDI